MPKIYYDMIQGSDEWLNARLGLPTSSDFDKIITPAGSPTKKETAEDYACKLTAEIMLKRPVMSISTPWMERGTIMEQTAADAYAMLKNVDLKRAGFVTDDLGRYGCSPDRLVEEDGLVEFKVPAEKTHIKYLWKKDLDKKYKPQLQGQLFVTERKWVDICSYNDDLPPAIIRVERDEAFIEKLAVRLDKFRDLMGQIILDFQSSGYLQIPETTILDAG